MTLTRAILIWAALALVIAVPLALSGVSPLLAWRQPIYIIGGFAGIVGLALMLVQPLAVGGYLPGFRGIGGRRLHLWVGILLVLALVVHVGALWITSPPDMIDALTFTSPTPFSAWGVVAMWAVFASAILAGLRRRIGLRRWRRAHTALALLVVPGSIVHALLITGTMEIWSKTLLCLLVGAATLRTIIARRVWA